MPSLDELETSMPYVRLGKSGLKVSKLILGCMSYGNSSFGTWTLGEAEGIKHIKRAYDLGINAFDTACNYSNGESEIILGKAIKQHDLPRDEIVIMTKLHNPVNREMTRSALYAMQEEQLDGARYANQYGQSRKNIFASVKHSLERLQLDYIDVLQCHRFDYKTPIEETMQALHDVVKAGLVRYIGMSSCYAWQFHKMQNYARTNHLTEFISMQNFYNAVYREEEREMIPLLQDLGVGMIPWSPLGMGFLARPAAEQATARGTDQLANGVREIFVGDHTKMTWMVTVNERVEAVAKAHNVSMARVAVAWCLSKPL